MIPHHKVNLQSTMCIPPKREFIHLAVMLAMEKITGDDKAIRLVMTEYAGKPNGITLLGTARHRDAMFTEVGALAPMHI
jgi:hypothetical protein